MCKYRHSLVSFTYSMLFLCTHTNLQLEIITTTIFQNLICLGCSVLILLFWWILLGVAKFTVWGFKDSLYGTVKINRIWQLMKTGSAEQIDSACDPYERSLSSFHWWSFYYSPVDPQADAGSILCHRQRRWNRQLCKHCDPLNPSSVLLACWFTPHSIGGVYHPHIMV